MKDPLQPIDLRENVLLGIEHICNSVDRERDCRPYFRFNLISPPVWSQHEAADTPHTVGRFLHALNLCHGIAGLAGRYGAAGGAAQTDFCQLRA